MTDDDNHQSSYAAARKSAANKRLEQRSAGNVPSHGPFYYIDGEIKGHPESIVGAAAGSAGLEPTVDDFKLWQHIVRTHPKLRDAIPSLQTYYTAFPRGMVVCSNGEPEFKVLLSPEIPESAYPAIVTAFGLQKYADGLEFDTSDTRFVRSPEDIDVLEYLLEQHGITDLAGRKDTPRRGDEECKKLLAQALHKQKVELNRRSAPARHAANARMAADLKESREKTKANQPPWGSQL